MQGHHLSIHVPCHPVWPEPVACSQVRRSRWRADLKGLGLKPCRYVCVEIWASAPEGTRTSSQHRSPSVAKATHNDSGLRHGWKPCPFKAKNRELPETIRRTSPQSLAELAERTGRKKPNLSRTLKTMEHYGLVQISRHKRKLVPRVRYQRVAVLMDLSA